MQNHVEKRLVNTPVSRCSTRRQKEQCKEGSILSTRDSVGFHGKGGGEKREKEKERKEEREKTKKERKKAPN